MELNWNHMAQYLRELLAEPCGRAGSPAGVTGRQAGRQPAARPGGGGARPRALAGLWGLAHGQLGRTPSPVTRLPWEVTRS